MPLYPSSQPFGNFSATTSPGVTDDSTRGYSVGSHWLNTTTGQIWVCRSASAGAAAWEAVFLSAIPGVYISGNWYKSIELIGSGPGSALSVGSLRLIPFRLHSRVTIQALGARITTASSGNNIQLGIYGHNYAAGKPTGPALATTTNISTTTVGLVNKALAAGNTTFEAGLYWAAVNSNNAVVVLEYPGQSSSIAGAWIGSPNQSDISSASAGAVLTWTTPMTFGTWGDVTSATWTRVTTPTAAFLHFQVA